MALLGLSLVLASVIYAAIWRPPFIQSLLSIWRGDPQIQQPPTTRRPSPADITVEHEEEEDQSAATTTTGRHTPSTATTQRSAAVAAADRAAMPPPPKLVMHQPKETATNSQTESSPSPQTTPRATASAQLNGDSIPSFSLSPDPPASAAAIARAVEANTSPSALPTFSAPSPPPEPLAPAKTSMAPPPRPPTLNNTGPSLLGVPPRAPIPNRHQYDRQPGTSTLAPPPTHSSKPAKPSRKVTLSPGRSPLDWARLSANPSADLRNLGPGAPYLRVPPSLLRRQTGRKGKDAWTALGGRVYNITPYLPFHPGGEPELLRAAGRDGTKLFGEIHPWVNYETMLSSCLIGLLVEEHEAQSTGEMEAMD
ncbi:hypothetical protein F5Y00DRAFT_168907 [Daldinia vernicosa]|uniref:uncharacterized protein n=1 Tax=Daldinia vernicosa TaxID=114800 RepID=UPI0020088121|nr:uncharacterized protein F5Y00DRAFT_168907 [Daldinia vernicosa]KAI0845489.1 hypothetical protein F5Y00DRAFT_168907 [Daldinia vernicosa]